MSLSIAILMLMQTTSAVDADDLALCMTHPVKDEKRSDLEFRVAVTPLLAKDLLTKGFTVMPCTNSGLTATQYRQSVCELAEGNSAVQARLEDALGVQPKLLCQDAISLGSILERVLGTSK